jgi:hypothetical protein
LHQKTEIADVVGQRMWIIGDTSGIIGSLSGRLACPRGILRSFSDPPLWLAAFCDASCLDVIIPGVLRVPVEVIVIHSGLNSSIFFKGDDLLHTGRNGALYCTLNASVQTMPFICLSADLRKNHRNIFLRVSRIKGTNRVKRAFHLFIVVR